MDTFGGMPLIASIALMALLALYLAIYPAITGYLLQKLSPNTGLSRNLMLFPALWTLTEWARGWVLTGFPWLWAGYSQTQGPLKPIASMTGTLSLSFIVALLAGALALAAAKRWRSLLVVVPTLAVLTFIAPLTSNVEAKGENLSVAVSTRQHSPKYEMGA